MNVLLLGAPGAGKGTQAEFIKQKHKLTPISTGDLLRNAIIQKTPLGLKAKDFMDNGKLVEDDLIINLVKEVINKENTFNGILFDGFPRTISQAKALIDENIKINIVLEFNVPDEDIIKRLSGRYIHQASGRIYHKIHNPPKINGKDDLTGEDLIQREDDRIDKIKKRLEIYHVSTKPLIDFYQNLDKKNEVKCHQIDGTQNIKTVQQRIEEILKI